MEATAVSSPIAKRSLSVRGHKTSISLEQDFWDAIKRIAVVNGQSVSDLVTAIDDTRSGNLSSALRVFVLSHYQELAKTRRATGPATDSTEPQPLLPPSPADKKADEAAAP